MPNEYDALFAPIGPRERVHSIASRLNLSPDIADDYLRLTQVESGHNVNVRDSPKGAKGFGQVMPDVPGGSTRTIGGTRYNLRDPEQNIEAGLRYFSEGGSDPVARRLHYFGGPRAKQTYERTGRIPNISDGLMTAQEYVRATGGTQQPQSDPYAALFDTPRQPQPAPTPAPRRQRPRTDDRSSALYGNAFAQADPATRQAIESAVADVESRARAPHLRKAIEDYERNRSQSSNLGELRRLDATRRPATLAELRQQDEPVAREVQREQRIRREVTADPLARAFPQRAQQEVQRRVQIERENEAKTQRDEPRIAQLTDEYRKQIRATAAATTGFSPLSPQWTQEVVSKAGAGLVQLGAAATRPFSTETADSLAIHAQALQRAAEEEGMDRSRVSKAVQNVIAGTLTSIPELAAMRAGVRAPVAFGAGGAARSYGRGERAGEIAQAGAHGAATGVIFEAPAALGVTNPLARVGTVGAGTGALELATGQPLDVALETGATNALMAGIGEVGRPRVRPTTPERTVDVEGRTTIPAEVEQIYQRQPASAPVESTPVVEPASVPRPRIEEVITSRAQRADRLTQLEGELAQWQRAGGRSRRGARRIRQIQGEIDTIRQSLQVEDAAAATQLAQERSAAVESTRYSPTPRFDEWVENRTGQRVAQVPETELAQLRDRYRQEFTNAPQPPVLREMPPLETPPVHHSLRQPRRVRGQGKGQFKRGKPVPIEEEIARPPLSPPVSPETARPEVAPPASETASLPRDRRSAERMPETDWLELTETEQRQMRNELEQSQRVTEPPNPAQVDILSERRSPSRISDKDYREARARWFGNSELRTATGEPETVYHFTTKDAELPIKQGGFDITKARARRSDEGVPDGIFFTPEAKPPFSDKIEMARIEAHLKMEKPLRVENREALIEWAKKRDVEYKRLTDSIARYDDSQRARLFREMQSENVETRQRAEKEYEALIEVATKARARLTATMKREGYDSMIMERDQGGPQVTTTYLVFEPTQVKSPRNRGVFDPKNPSIIDFVPKTPSGTTSARRAQMTADRAELDLPELPAPQRKAWQETLDQAKAKGTANAATLAEQVLNKPRSLNDVETAQLVLRAQEIKNELSVLRKEIVNEPTPERIAQSDALQEEFNRLTQATKTSGTEKGRTLAAQKLTINRDYDLTSLIQRATEAKGRRLTPEETTRYEQMAQRIAELESQVSTTAAKSVTTDIQREIERVSRQRKRAETKQALDEEFAQLKAQFQQARAEARKVQGSGLAGLDPEGKITPLIARMAKNRIKAGIKSAEALVSEIYETVREHGWTKDDVAHVVRSTITQSDDVLSRWDKRRQGQLIKQQEELQRRLAQRDFTKPAPRQPPIYNRETQRLAEQVQSLKNKFELEMQREQPGHWWRTLSSLRKSWMLSGLSTQAKNIGGTGGYQVFEELARLPAAIADAAVAPFTGRRTLTTSPAQMLDAVLHARRQGLTEAGQILRRGATPEQLERHQFSEIDTGVKVIDFASNLVFRFMSASDRLFYQYSYKRSLNDRAMAQAKNEGAGRQRARELSENPPEELDAAAKHDALVGTFNNNNRLSDAIKSARARLGPKANFAIDIVMPFDRTPTNVIARVLEASPVGLGQSAYRAAKAIVNKSMTPAEQRQFSQTLGRATVGTALLALGWKLADDAFDIEDNGQVYLNVGGRRYNLNSISPVGNLLAVGAKLKQDYKKGDALGATKTVARTPLDQPLLRAGSEVTELLRDPERSAVRTAARTASSFIPFGGALRDVSKAIDPEERRFPDPRSFTQQVQQGIPKLRERLPVSRSKVFSGQTSSSPATKEIQRLKMRLQGAMPGDDEPPPQYEKRREVMNPAVVKELERLVQSPGYARLSDDDKRKQIRAVVQSVASAFRPSGTSRRPARPSRRDLRP